MKTEELTMHVANKVKSMRLAQGMTQEDLGIKLNTTKQTIGRYENGSRKISQDLLFELAEIFNCSIDDFFPKIKTDGTINSIFNQLNPIRQQKVYSFAENQLEEQNSNIVDLRQWKDVYIQSKVSAGCGIVDLDQQHKELISYDGYVPPKYDLAFQVEGNSMEPMFRNGEVIFVEHQEEVRNGQLGVVTINDEAYIKKIYLEDDCLRLVSLNKEYDDIIADGEDTIKVVGKVIL